MRHAPAASPTHIVCVCADTRQCCYAHEPWHSSEPLALSLRMHSQRHAQTCDSAPPCWLPRPVAVAVAVALVGSQQHWMHSWMTWRMQGT